MSNQRLDRKVVRNMARFLLATTSPESDCAARRVEIAQRLLDEHGLSLIPDFSKPLDEDCWLMGSHDWPPELTPEAECVRCGLAYEDWSQ